MVHTISNPVRDRIMAENGFPREQIQDYQPGDIPTHYVPLVFAMSSMEGEQRDTLSTLTQYAASLPEQRRSSAFRFAIAPTATMRNGTSWPDGVPIDPGFGDHPIMLIHADVLGDLLARGTLVRDDLDKGVTCSFTPGRGAKDPDGCYQIKGFASALADKPKNWTVGR